MYLLYIKFPVISIKLYFFNNLVWIFCRSIYMDSDCLIHAGSGIDQVTWMDVRVGDWVVTPRHGKPVEINALCMVQCPAGNV